MWRKIALELLIALRYLRAHSRTLLFNDRVRFSISFMSLMIFIMVLVLSVFSGFEQEIHKLLMNSGYHLTITRSDAGFPISGKRQRRMLADFQKDKELKSIMASSFPSISFNALIGIEDRFEGKKIRAIPIEFDRDSGELKNFPGLVHYNIEYLNRLKSGNFILIGRKLAREYKYKIGDSIEIFLPVGGPYGGGIQVKHATLKIAGFFRTGFNEFDANLLFLSLRTAQKITAMDQQVNEIIVQLKDISTITRAKKLIRENIFGETYRFSISSIRDERGNFLAAVNLEKTLMMIVLGLLIVAGAAGILVTVFLLVNEKVKSTGMLLAMGLPVRSIHIIFTTNALLIGLLATTIGGSLGIFVSNHLEQMIHMCENLINSFCSNWLKNCSPVHIIPENIYYFDYLPVYADIRITFGIGLASMVLIGLAGYFPSRRAAKLNPAESIRIE